jgi:salicylate hydroxylase/6-hydroxynicotinate 3-monooxygenase
MSSKPRIAIIGAGMGGLATASALIAAGFDVRVYEQAQRFTRLGAGIQMSPNAVKALRGLGLETAVRKTAFRPGSWQNRQWDTGELMYELPLGTEAEQRYGAAYLQMHRGDLHEALLSAIPEGTIELDKQLTGVEPGPGGSKLLFAEGGTAEADLVIGADGIHSRVREILLGPDRPLETGRVAYRATFPAALLSHPVGECTKWWGPDRHIVIYYTNAIKTEIYFVTSLPEDTSAEESWSSTGDMSVVRDAFEGFHEEVRDVLRACPSVHRWAILVRDPLEHWFRDGMVLLGDAAHPMTPYMAQGAATAIEDGVMLARALARHDGLEDALQLYQAARQKRTAQIQAVSLANTWMREATDPAWCYDYDPWTEPL